MVVSFLHNGASLQKAKGWFLRVKILEQPRQPGRGGNIDRGLVDLILHFHTTTETETLLPRCEDRQMSLQNRQSQTRLPAAQVMGGWRSCQGCLARERMISQQRMLEQLEMPVKTGNWKRSRPFPHTVYKVKVSEQIRAGEEGRRQRRPNSWRQTGSELGPRAGTHEENMWRLNSIVTFIHSFLCCVCELKWSHLVASAFSWWAV